MSKCDSHLIFEALEKRPGVSIDEGLIFDLENIAKACPFGTANHVCLVCHLGEHKR